jgi:hypothetical protein
LLAILDGTAIVSPQERHCTPWYFSILVPSVIVNLVSG